MIGPRDSAPNRLEVRLAFRHAYWRIFGLLMLLGVLAVGLGLQRLGLNPREKLVLAVIYSPVLVFQCLMFAGAIAGLADLFLRFGARPQLHRWLSPPMMEGLDQLHRFHFAPGEETCWWMTGRRRSGRRTEPGSIVLTDRRLWFFPRSWTESPWSTPFDQIQCVELEETSRIAWGLIQGLPHQVVVVDGAATRNRFLTVEPHELSCRLTGIGVRTGPSTSEIHGMSRTKPRSAPSEKTHG